MKIYYLLLSAAIISSCGGGEEKPESTETETTTEETQETTEEKSYKLTAEEGAVYLRGLYASNTASDANVADVLDDDPNTAWKTPAGSGPDEGVMVQFLAPTQVSTVSVLPATGDFAAIERVVCYADGQRLGFFNPGEDIKVDKEISSFYVRISRTGSMKNTEIDNGEECESVTLTTFDASKSVGIGELVFKNGEERLALQPPMKVEGSVSASSTLEPEAAYNPGNAIDSRNEFAWVEGHEESGVGESFSFATRDQVEVNALLMANGYQRSKKHFEDNNRIRKMSVTAGETTVEVDVANEMGVQKIELSEPLVGNTFTFKILEVYDGKKYKDCAISEVLLFSGDVPFTVDFDSKKAIASANIEKAGGKPAAKILDRRISNSVSDECGGGGAVERSIILRSNGTFVMYETSFATEYTEDGPDQLKSDIVADGNWEFKDVNGNDATVRVFGKHVNLTKVSNVYKGTSQSEFLRIFQDNVGIGGGEIKGDRFIGSILTD